MEEESTTGNLQRAPAETLYAAELDELIKHDKFDRPPGWRMSARAVLTYICGGKAGTLDVTPKYIGHRRLVEIAISTLVTDRSLLLLGEPGTAKSWLSEHLAVPAAKRTVHGRLDCRRRYPDRRCAQGFAGKR